MVNMSLVPDLLPETAARPRPLPPPPPVHDPLSVKGHLLYLPAEDITVVPAMNMGCGWECVVVAGSPAHPVNGFTLYVENERLGNARRVLTEDQIRGARL